MVRLTGKGTTATEKTVCHAPGSREEGKLHTMQGHVEKYQTTQEAQREAETVDKCFPWEGRAFIVLSVRRAS